MDVSEHFEDQAETTDETTLDEWPSSTANQSRTRI